MTASPEDTPSPSTAQTSDSTAPPSGEPAPKASTPAAAATSRPWSYTVVATLVLATAAIAVMLLAGRPGASPESPPAETAVPAARPAAPPPSSGSGANLGRSAAPKWSGSKKPGWATDGSRTLTFQLAAESYVPVWMKRVRPVLAVRCLGGATEVFVVTESAAAYEGNAGRHTVRVAFDEGTQVEQHWTDSSDYQSLFAPDGEALARQIAGAKRMRFEFTPYNATPVAADFDVRGFDQYLDSIAKICRWKK